MRRRVDAARHDSDVALFYDLLGYGELVTKLATVAMIAAIEEDSGRRRYRLEYDLVRADGVGAYGSTLQSLVTGRGRSLLRQEAGAELTDLTAKHSHQDDSWQRQALSALHTAGLEMDAAMPEMASRVYGWMWFTAFPILRNRTRGHGAPRPGPCQRACPPLEESINLVVDNFRAFQRPWAVVHRHLSGRSRIAPIGNVAPEEEAAFELDPLARDGVYVMFSEPRRVPLVESEPDQADFRVANGGFSETTGRFELLSYVRDERRTADGTSYLTPPARLPASETEGMGSLRPLGRSMSNLPGPPSEYVRRSDLEGELSAVLVNDRHPVVTLVGAGGIGKTSLALQVLQDLSAIERYGLILWFSARDVDLLETGPKPVAPHVRSPQEMAEVFVRLISRDGSSTDEAPTDLLAGALANGIEGQSVLFAFDNFETVNNAVELYRWLDTYVRNPNSVLITTRQRTFKGDYPIEVTGMSRSEFYVLVDTMGEALGIRGILGEERKDELFREADGHPYVGKVLIGEMARTRRANVKRIVGSRSDILDALFERTFVALPATAQRVFLTVAQVSSPIARLALEAVMLRPSNERLDVERSIEALHQASLIELVAEQQSGDDLVRVPAVAAFFGRQKFSVSPMRVQVLRDLHFLKHFAAADTRLEESALGRQVAQFFDRIVGILNTPEGSLEEYAPILEYIARRRPPVWLMLAELFEDFRPGWVGLDRAAEAVRNYLEAQPDDSDAWTWLSELASESGDYLGSITALVERATIADADFADIAFAAQKLNEYFANNDDLSSEERDSLIDRMLHLIEPRADEANGTDCSAIAWLLLKRRERSKAREYVLKGLRLEPSNAHCLRLLEIVGPASSPNGEQDPKEQQRSALDLVRRELERLARDPGRRAILRTSGIQLGTIGLDLRRAQLKVSPQALGFRNLQSLVQEALQGSELTLVRRLHEAPPHPRLALRAEPPPGTTPFVDADKSTLGAWEAGPEHGTDGDQPRSYLSDPRLRAQLEDFPPLTDVADAAAVRRHATRALEHALEHEQLRAQALQEGIVLEAIAPAVRHAVPFLRPLALGYPNMRHFLVDALQDSTLALGVREGELPPRLRLVFTHSIPPGTRLLDARQDRGEHLPPESRLTPDLSRGELYRRILAQGYPILRLPDSVNVGEVAAWLAEHPPEKRSLRQIIEDVGHALDSPSDVVKLPLLAFVAVGAFVREPDKRPLAEQALTLRKGMREAGQLVTAVRAAADAKLRRKLGSVDSELLESFLRSRGAGEV